MVCLFKRKPKRYYREYLVCHGWGVMLGYDSVIATSQYKAHQMPKRQAYCPSYECVIKVKKKHLHLSDEALSEIYGHQSKEKK